MAKFIESMELWGHPAFVEVRKLLGINDDVFALSIEIHPGSPVRVIENRPALWRSDDGDKDGGRGEPGETRSRP
jgi:hypothetical protein